MARTRQRHPWRTLVIILVVLAVLVIAADRITLAVSENIAAKNIQQSQNLPDRPDVTVDGVPFLTQLASSSYGKVTVSAKQIPVGQGDRRSTLSTLSVTMRDVDTSRNFDHIHAKTASATGSLDYPQLRAATDVDVEWAGNGRVRATKTVTVLGQTVTATVAAKPVLQGDAIAFTDVELLNVGDVAGSVTKTLTSLFDVTVPLTGLPFGLKVTSLTVSAGGVAFALAGTDITLDKTSS